MTPVMTVTTIAWRTLTLYGTRGVGTFTFRTMTGWEGLPDAREEFDDRLQAHGSFDAPPLSGPRRVVVTGACQTPAERDAMLIELGATMTFADPDSRVEDLMIDHAGRVLTAGARLTRYEPIPDVWGDGTFGWKAEWVCPDPLRYAAPVVTPTGFAQLLGGLAFDLFTDGTLPTVRTNLVTNPSFEVNTTGWRGIAARVADGPAETGSWAGTHTSLVAGGFYVGTNVGVFSAGSGEVVSTLVWAKVPIGRSFQMRVTFRAAGGAVVPGGDMLGSSLAGTGEWSSYLVTTTAPAEATITNYDVGLQGTVGWLTNDVLAIAALLVVKGSYSGPYFDGATPDTADTDYAWTGTAHASASTQSVVDPASVTGLLEYGDPGTETGMVDVTNTGTAPAWLVFTVTGPTPPEGFDVLVAGERLRYSLPLGSGEVLIIDTATGTVLLGGVDRRFALTIREWRAVAPGETATVVFTPLGGPTSGVLSISLAPTYW